MPRYPTFPDCFDEVKQITITGLKRCGFFRPNMITRGSYGWTRDGQNSELIEITACLADRYIELNYVYGDEPIAYRVELESISKHFGGCEWYFICPETDRRCRKLYGIGKLFLSRFAYPSTMYSIQTESKRGREIMKALRCIEIRRELQTRRHCPPKYKGTETKRYRRMIEKATRIDIEVFEGVFKR